MREEWKIKVFLTRKSEVKSGIRVRQLCDDNYFHTNPLNLYLHIVNVSFMQVITGPIKKT